jgi:hypothetical protein
MTYPARVLIVLAWGLFAVSLVFLFLIARFYQRKSGVNVRAGLFLGPPILFLLAALRYALLAAEFEGDVLGDLLFCVGGVWLLLIARHLTDVMLRRR